MKKKLLSISGKIDWFTLAIYELIDSVAESQGIKFVVIGATARDMVLHCGFGIEARRATKDIDLAVQVSSWGEFETLKGALVNTGKFATTSMVQRLLYQEMTPLDIVPFGIIREADGLISWPPDHEVRMNILGFEDAYNNAIAVRLRVNPVLDVLVASPPSLIAMKLIAWKERAPENTRDAIDLIFIIRNYLDIGNHERLLEEYPDLLLGDFDYIRAGARMLGRDMAKILGSMTLSLCKQIIEEQTDEQDIYSLVEDMSSRGSADDFEANLALLKLVGQGLCDVMG